jgi:23S rRNA (guanosine2251-2'-O)-methyltransferase
VPRRDSARPRDEGVVAGRRPIIELLDSGQPIERILVSRDLAPSGIIGRIRKKAEDRSVPLRVVPKTEVDCLAPDLNHQGVVAVAGRYRYSSLDELLEAPEPVLLFLDGVTDPHNLGSLLRSADGAGIDGVILPSHRSATVNDTVRRISAGAAEVVKVARVGSLGVALERARDAGLWLVGLDERGKQDIWESELIQPPVALVVGSEDRGLGKAVRDRCDELVKIPQFGALASLNVGVAGAIAMYEVARRRRDRGWQP